ncbi:MAG: GTP 3',8-cyclase MoaA [Pseudomonadota bacterium]
MTGTLAPLIDPYGRQITYLRLSVTDRCDLRCTYCMAERMQFLPKAELLTIEELLRLARDFIDLGISKLRVTGGEPLVRRGIMDLFRGLSADLGASRLRELTLTTNGTQLAHHAEALYGFGVKRINVSLDTLDTERYRELTRGGDITQALAGIEAAKSAGLHVKINAVALAGDGEGLYRLVEWAHAEGHDVSLIETMPLGETGVERSDAFLSLTAWRDEAERRWTLTDLPDSTGGPSRYVRVAETGGRLGFITPLTNNFCAGCNRVRLTCTGQFFPCLGQAEQVDFRAMMRDGIDDDGLRAAIRQAIGVKPEAHDFVIAPGSAPALDRHMSVTGG